MPDSVAITLSATTLEGLPALDPAVVVTITQTIPSEEPIFRTVVENFTGTAIIDVPYPDGFPMWRVDVTFSRYDTVSGYTFMPRGNRSPTISLQLTRMPSAWTPHFVPLATLPLPRFQPFRDIVAKSSNVDLKFGRPVGDLNANYDTLSDPAQIQAKTALLNLFAVLSDQQDPIGKVPWFSYVRQIVRLDQERFIAEMDPTLFENVQTILNELTTTYRGQGYFTEPDLDLRLHIPNIPPRYGAPANIQLMKTLKIDYEQGDLQLTVTYLVVDGKAVHLLDCDLDENRNLLLHSLDLLKHLFNGGTSPITMHEYIVEQSAENSGTGRSTVVLGYDLA